MITRWGATGGLLVALAACSDISDGPDPYEATNRQIYDFNVAVDRALLRPASEANSGVPVPVRTAITNFGDNLDQPRSIVNDVLQGDGEDAVHNTFRFLINTTLGVGGLFDPAKAFGLEDRETGFADTMAVWGVGPGAYQVLPLLGPSTERDTAGYIVDIFLNPLDILVDNDLISEDVAAVSLPASAFEILNERTVFSATVDGIFYESADGYEQARIIYLDNRRFEVSEAGADEAGETIEDIYEELYDE